MTRWVKVKVTLEQATTAQRGSRCVALLFLQLRRMMWVGGQRHAPAALPPGKTQYPLYRSLGGPQGRSGRIQKIPSPPEFDPQTVQSRSESLYRLSYPGPRLEGNRGKYAEGGSRVYVVRWWERAIEFNWAASVLVLFGNRKRILV